MGLISKFGKKPYKSQDSKQCSHKMNHTALKYEIAISVFHPKVVWINGPYKGSVHDKTIFQEKLMGKIARGKKVICNGGYAMPEAITATPNTFDSKKLHNFKSRARTRHETFNGRLKIFSTLENTFCHSISKHKLAFEAICVTVQYQMEHDLPIFDV